MPGYFKKAFTIGPLRLNLSKSGVGLSFGITGLRIGTGPRGPYIHAGREGIYYRKSLNNTQEECSHEEFENIEPEQVPEDPKEKFLFYFKKSIKFIISIFLIMLIVYIVIFFGILYLIYYIIKPSKRKRKRKH